MGLKGWGQGVKGVFNHQVNDSFKLNLIKKKKIIIIEELQQQR